MVGSQASPTAIPDRRHAVNPYRTRLQLQTAQAIVDPIQPGYLVIDVIARTGGEVSSVYEIRGAGSARPLIVKVYAPRWRSKPIKEVYVYRLLARHGIRHIPQVLHAAPFGVPALPLAYTVMTRLDGQPLSQVRDDLTGTDIDIVYGRWATSSPPYTGSPRITGVT
jgi:hypothetical protein